MSAVRRWLGSDAVAGDVRLRLACAALLLFHCHTFGVWHADHAAVLSTYGILTGNVLPTPLALALGGPFFPSPFWTLFHLAGLYFLGLWGLLFLFRKDCLGALVILAFLSANKLYYYASDLRLHADTHPLHLFLTFLFLIARDKLFFFRAGVVVSYWVLARAKLNASWLGGEYFLSLPEFPPAAAGLAPLWVVWEALGPLLWLTRSRPARLAAVVVFAAAHLVYGALGAPDFAYLMLPVLIIAFYDAEDGLRQNRPQPAAWLALAAMLAVGVPLAQDNRAGNVQIVIEKAGQVRSFEVEWPWRLPTRLSDGTTLPAGVPTYRGDWRRTVRDGEVLVFNPYAFVSLPNRLLGPWPFKAYARRLCRDWRPDHVRVTLDVRRDGRMQADRVLDAAELCTP